MGGDAERNATSSHTTLTLAVQDDEQSGKSNQVIFFLCIDISHRIIIIIFLQFDDNNLEFQGQPTTHTQTHTLFSPHFFCFVIVFILSIKTFHIHVEHAILLVT